LAGFWLMYIVLHFGSQFRWTWIPPLCI